MRSVLASAVLLASLALPAAAAHADTFVLNPIGGDAVSFSLSGPPSLVSYNGSGEYDNVAISVSGATYQNGSVVFYNPVNTQGIDFSFSLSIKSPTYFVGAQLFTGDIHSPSFAAGTYPLINADRGTLATLVVNGGVPSALSATPEPSSLALLGTGVLGLAGAARRRLLRA